MTLLLTQIHGQRDIPTSDAEIAGIFVAALLLGSIAVALAAWRE